jgi:hypothetical protein
VRSSSVYSSDEDLEEDALLSVVLVSVDLLSEDLLSDDDESEDAEAESLFLFLLELEEELLDDLLSVLYQPDPLKIIPAG